MWLSVSLRLPCLDEWKKPHQNNWMQSVASTWSCQSRGNWCSSAASHCNPQPVRYRLFLTASCISFRNAKRRKGPMSLQCPCQYETARAVCCDPLRKLFFLKLNCAVLAAKSAQRCIGLMHRGHWWGMFEALRVDPAVSQDTLQVRIRSRGVTIHRYAATWDDSRLQQSNPKPQMSLERLWT